MTFIVWRQHRVQLAAGLGVLVVVAGVLVWTGHEMTSYLHTSGLSACMASSDGCDEFSRLFENHYGGLLRNVAYLNFLPMLVGVFWGAPLVAREFESGTYKLAWTQSITRRRWLATKLGVFAVATAAVSAVFSVLLSWWLHPFAQLNFGGGFSRMDLNSFDFQGIVPVGYSLFALAAGTAAGVVTRRVLPAMAATFAVYLPLRLWVQTLREHFQPPLHLTYLALHTSPRARLGDWVLQSQTIDAHGQLVSDQTIITTCGLGPAAAKTDVSGCMTAHGFRAVDTYQPASRFWTFQAIEFAIFAGAALLLLTLTYYWVTRRSHT
jgi:ABC-2 family transporter protein